jgi:UDP-2,3-diacylglucosamine pyrophosphatase LpxH
MFQGESFSLHKVVLDCVPNHQKFHLLPFGDVHYGSPMHHEEKFEEFLSWARHKKDCLFLGMGDYLDFMSMSERRGLINAHLHESSMSTIDDLMKEQTDKLCKKLAFMKGNIIGLIEGNHYGMFCNNTTTTQRMCEKLGCKYLGIAAFIRIVFKDGSRSTSVDVLCHHGKGGSGRMVGSDVNHIQAMTDVGNAQIYLMGHTHKKTVAMKTRLSLIDGKGGMSLRQQKLLFGRTGSFLKGYMDGKPSYVTKALLSPVDLGTIRIELAPRRDSSKVEDNVHDNLYVDIHGSL